MDRVAHWNRAHHDKGDDVSWYQDVPTTSLELIEHLDVGPDDAIIDIGGGTSRLVDHLVGRGHRDVSVLDVSEAALATVRDRLGVGAGVDFVAADLLTWEPSRTYRLWHDRAVLHFLVGEADRARYRELVGAAVGPGGAVVIATFDRDGPETCSGLTVRRSSPADVLALLGPAFEPLEQRHEVHTTPWGTRQPFAWVAARRR